VLAALLPLLAGCVTAGEAVPEPTVHELETLNERVRQLQWQFLQFSPDSPRPPVDFVSFVDPANTEQAYAACMQAAGHEGWTPSNSSALGGPPIGERLDLYICIAQYPIAPSYYGLYTPAQLGAIYDYYRDSLVPCIRAAGVGVGEPPTRAEFVAIPKGFRVLWTPYDAGAPGLTQTEKQSLYTKCPDLSFSFFADWE